MAKKFLLLLVAITPFSRLRILLYRLLFGYRISFDSVIGFGNFLHLVEAEITGARIIHRSLEEPVRQIAENSGEEGSVVVNKVRDLKAGEGLNAATGEYGDLIKDGVIDPTMVTRSALQNAASIAKNILTTECIVAEPPEEGGAGGGMPGGMPDMGGMM